VLRIGLRISGVKHTAEIAPPTAAAIIASVATAAMVTSIGHHLTHHHTAEETHARAHCNIATRVWGERGGRVASFVVG
jgi:hypothetical protein